MLAFGGGLCSLSTSSLLCFMCFLKPWPIKRTKENICYSAPDNATAEALRYIARTKQRRTYLLLELPSRSRYSFTDPKRMEG